MFEIIIARIKRYHKPKDKYYVQRIYFATGEVKVIDCVGDYQMGVFYFQEFVKTFDIGYSGYVILFKNKLQNEVIRVNL